jgi:hypothetical protein
MLARRRNVRCGISRNNRSRKFNQGHVIRSLNELSNCSLFTSNTNPGPMTTSTPSLLGSVIALETVARLVSQHYVRIILFALPVFVLTFIYRYHMTMASIASRRYLYDRGTTPHVRGRQSLWRPPSTTTTTTFTLPHHRQRLRPTDSDSCSLTMDATPAALFDSYEQNFKHIIQSISDKLEGKKEKRINLEAWTRWSRRYRTFSISYGSCTNINSYSFLGISSWSWDPGHSAVCWTSPSRNVQ